MKLKMNILLAVGITILFLGVTVQPAIATVQKETTSEPMINPDDTRYLANLSMDFGENISNNRIEYESIPKRPAGDWTVNVKINFRCPENRKIIVRYEYFAFIFDRHDIFHEFYDVKDKVVITNGSNPPDINDSKTLFVAHRPYQLFIQISIKANLTAYEFIDGQWEKINTDEILNGVLDQVEFSKCRTIAKTWFLMRLFERIPVLYKLLDYFL